MTTLADLLPISVDTAKWDVAACRGDQHPDRWFPDPSETFDYAATVCGRWPLAQGCGTYARETGQTGVWGGREYRRGELIR